MTLGALGAVQGQGGAGELPVVEGPDSGAVEPSELPNDPGHGKRCHFHGNQKHRPVANAGPDIVVHLGELATFDGSASFARKGHLVSYRWDFGDGTTGRGAIVTHAYATLGDFTAKLVVMDNHRRCGTDKAVVTVNTVLNHPPVAEAGPDQSGVRTADVMFDGSASSDPDGTKLSYEWNFGDGSSGTGVTTGKRYASTGTFTVTLTVTDDKGASASDTLNVTIVNLPPVAVAGSDLHGTKAVAVTLDGSGSYDPDGMITSYSWEFGDGSFGAGAAQSHTYPVIGTYVARLTVQDNDGAVSSETAVVAISGQPPDALAGADRAANVGEQVVFDGATSFDQDGTIIAYHWDFGDGTMSSSIVTSHAYYSPGTYIATLTVTDNDGLSDQDSRVITVAYAQAVASSASAQSPIGTVAGLGVNSGAIEVSAPAPAPAQTFECCTASNARFMLVAGPGR